MNLEGVLTWAFEFEDQPFFAGFRVLASNGIDLPVLNVFRMFSLMGGRRLESQSTSEVSLDDILARGVRGKPDVSARACIEGDTLAILVWHYHDDDVAGPDALVTLDVNGVAPEAGPVLVHHYRVDADHSNSYESWKRMGSPQQPTPRQYAELERSSQLALLDSPIWIRPEKGKLQLRVTLPRQAVSLLRLELRRAARGKDQPTSGRAVGPQRQR